MRKLKLVWLLLLNLTICRSQDKAFMEDRFAKFSDKLPIESVYLHIDRYKFQAGDTLWWKGYLFSGDERPAISTNLTVELYSDSGRLICRMLAPVIRSFSAGQIQLPDSLKTGRYYLRAYTKYQTNFDSAKFFIAPIAVCNKNDPKEVLVALRKDPDPEPKTTLIDNLFWVSSVNANVLYCLLETDSVSKYLDKTLTVVVMSYHQPICRASLKLTREKLWHDFTLPCTNMEGYVDMLLWADSQLIARQSLFIRQKEGPAVAILPDTLNRDPHGYNSWKVHIEDSILYNCSVSVTDADRTDEAPLDILYALNPDPVNYRDMLTGKFPEIKVADTNYLTWEGRVIRDTTTKSSKRKKFKKAELVTLISGLSESGMPDTRLIPLDTAGRFALNGLFFFDKARMNFQLNHSSGDESRAIKMILTDKFAVPIFRRPSSDIWTDSVQQTDLLADNSIAVPSQFPKAKTLDTVTVKAKKMDIREELDGKYTTGIFSEPTLFSYDLRNEKTYHDLQEYLRANIPGFECNPPSDTPSWKRRPVIFYLDEQLADWDNLKTFRLTDLAYIKSFLDEHWFGDSPFMRWKTGYKGAMLQPVPGATGEKPGLKMPVDLDPLIVCLYMKKGLDYRTGSPDLNSVALDGYSPIAQFQGAGNKGWTLFWNPLEMSNDFRIQFSNNMISKRFRVCIEGINGAGKMVHYEKTIPE